MRIMHYIDVFIKCAWVTFWLIKNKGVLDGFIDIVHESNREPNILSNHQVREFFKNLSKKSVI